MPAALAHEPESPQRITQLAGVTAGAITAAGAQHDLHFDNRQPLGLDLRQDSAQQVLEPLVERSAPRCLGLLDRVVLSAVLRHMGVQLGSGAPFKVCSSWRVASLGRGRFPSLAFAVRPGQAGPLDRGAVAASGAPARAKTYWCTSLKFKFCPPFDGVRPWFGFARLRDFEWVSILLLYMCGVL